MKRDRQRSAVYSWETANIAPHDRTIVPFAQIKVIVDHVWKDMGLEYPPLVEPLPKQDKSSGDASREVVRFRETTYTWIILHELAHSMTSIADGPSNKHGALFMGIYLRMAARYLGLDHAVLVKSARDYGLRVTEDAVPVFL
jgi:hypothetical protein